MTMKLTVSKGNMKLGNMPNLSLPPIVTCGDCHLCAKQCYAMKSFRQHPNVRKAWRGNWDLWKKEPVEFEYQLQEYLSDHMPRFFRWHVGGDVPSPRYRDMMVRAAKEYLDTKFLVFSKRWEYWMVLSEIPKNLSVVISRWPGDIMPVGVPRTFGQAWLDDPKNPDGRIPINARRCPGSCTDCKMCFDLGPGKNVVFHVH